MKFIETKNLNSEEKEAVFKLWNQEYPKSLSYSKMAEFDSYLNGLSELYHVLVKDESDNIVGWYSDFKRDNEIWFAMILDDSIQGKGIGTNLLNTAKKRNKYLSGWVIDRPENIKCDDSFYLSPLGFYLKNDFIIEKERRLELSQISAVKIKWVQ
jgi:GNAT superfamily N-acetyltransferase